MNNFTILYIYTIILGGIIGCLLYLIINKNKELRYLRFIISKHYSPESIINSDVTYIEHLDAIKFKHLGFKCKNIIDSNGNLYIRTKKEHHE